MDKRTASQKNTQQPASGTSLPVNIPLPLEIRVHGRGGQGGVTCAKLIAGTYAQLGLKVQTFGDYGAERTGAPIRAFTRVDRAPIKNRNKVYQPDHLLVLDTGLLGANLLEGVSAKASMLINSSEDPELLRQQYPGHRLAVVDATAIARKHGIGTSALVIINTTIVGAYAAFMDLPMEAVQEAYDFFGLGDDFAAAVEAGESVKIFAATEALAGETEEAVVSPPPQAVLPLTEHRLDIPAELKTGAWSTQTPCYQEYAAPCSLACPAGNDVVGFIQALKEEGVAAAGRLLRKTQALPSVCGRVCPGFCMGACNREFYDGAVNIRSLERWVADNDTIDISAETVESPKHFAVIGSGPAGLSAAFHLGVLGQRVTLFEKDGSLGGVLRTGIPAYRLPEEVLDRDIDRILRLGVEVHSRTDIDTEKMARLLAEFDAVIVCKGFGLPLDLEAAGDRLCGVRQGLEFLAEAKERQVKVTGTVIVVGGGNTAIDCARSALRAGASSVKLVYRRSRREMPAIAEEIEEAVHEGMELLTHRQPVALIGQSQVRGMVLAEVDAGPVDEDGRRRPIVSERTMELDCDLVLLALGQEKRRDLLPEGAVIRNNRAWRGDAPLQLWFAGDCLTGEGTVAHAIGNGRRTALAALASLTGEEQQQEKEYKSTVAPAHIRFSHFPPTPPQRDRRQPAGPLRGNFDEVNLGLPGPGEAERCFSCGRCTRCDTCLVFCPDGVILRDESGYVIDRNYCKGCGICVAECPRRAMEMIDK